MYLNSVMNEELRTIQIIIQDSVNIKMYTHISYLRDCLSSDIANQATRL